MKSGWIIIPAFTAMTLASCGGSSEEANNTNSTAAATDSVVVEEPKELVKDYNYFVEKFAGMELEGITLTPDNENNDSINQTSRKGWKTDPAAAGCDKIQLNSYLLSTTANRAEVESKSLAAFEEYQMKYLTEGVKASDFKEYTKDSLTFYYCTMKGCNETFGKSNFNQIYFSHFTGNTGVNGWIKVYDPKMEMTQAEATAVKIMDFIAIP
ncbi:MAG: hypothetical protein IPM77_00070 [Crocinitomicaceae bacterium]|nr:hypothetical protein [Crocinitomicaceae bacterium]